MELGIADGAKGLERIAQFRASDSGDEWASWEYLGVYRRISFGKLEGEPAPVWMVIDQKCNTAATLKRCLIATP